MGTQGPNAENQEDPGLAGTHDSFQYRIAEIERHLHHWERMAGIAGTPTATHKADPLVDNPEPFVFTSGNDDWGPWVQVLGSDDTPFIVGNTKMDMNMMKVVGASQVDAVYLVQLGFGADGATVLSSGDFSEVIAVTPTGVGEPPSDTVSLTGRRVDTGSLMWGRVLCRGQNAKTLSAYFGGHEYEA